jgi:hypothetical protein
MNVNLPLLTASFIRAVERLGHFYTKNNANIIHPPVVTV